MFSGLYNSQSNRVQGSSSDLFEFLSTSLPLVNSIIPSVVSAAIRTWPQNVSEQTRWFLYCGHIIMGTDDRVSYLCRYVAIVRNLVIRSHNYVATVKEPSRLF